MMIENQVEFVLKTDKKYLQNKVNQMVNSRMNRLNKNLEQRRVKLYNRLSEEANILNQEMLIYETRKEQEKEIRKRVKAMEIQYREECKRKETVAEKEAQRIRENSDDKKFQEFFGQRHEVAKMQKHQMLEKKKMSLMEKELDNIWKEISKELCNITEYEEKRKKTQEIINKKIYNEKLLEQIKEKINMANEDLYERIMDKFELEELAEKYKNDKIKENEENILKRQQLAKAKLENYKQSITMKNEKEKEEKFLNQYYQKLNQYDPKEEKYKQQKEKEQVRAELDFFKSQVLAVRRKQEEEEKIENEIRAWESSKIEQKNIEMKKIEQMQKIKFEKDVMKMRMEQLMHKKERTHRWA